MAGAQGWGSGHRTPNWYLGTLTIERKEFEKTAELARSLPCLPFFTLKPPCAGKEGLVTETVNWPEGGANLLPLFLHAAQTPAFSVLR